MFAEVLNSNKVEAGSIAFIKSRCAWPTILNFNSPGAALLPKADPLKLVGNARTVKQRTIVVPVMFAETQSSDKAVAVNIVYTRLRFVWEKGCNDHQQKSVLIKGM